LQRYNLPVDISASELGFSREKLLSACLRNVNKDKKRLNNQLRLILATEIGEASVFPEVPFKFIENAFNEIIKV
jgi:3-dehydroquinate synthetase